MFFRRRTILVSALITGILGATAWGLLPGVHPFSWATEQAAVSQVEQAQVFESEYIVWPNGGGKVHPLARVAESAFVDITSTIGPYVTVGDYSQIVRSELSGESDSLRLVIGESTLIRDSSLAGPVQLSAHVKVESSTLKGLIRVNSDIAIVECTLSAAEAWFDEAVHPAVVHRDLSRQMLILPREKRET